MTHSKGKSTRNITLVTGGTGFIGKILVKRLDGNIRLLSRALNDKYDTVVCDLSRDSIPDHALDGVRSVIHLAGVAHDTRDASKYIDLYQRVNVEATSQLAKLAAKSGVDSFVFLSSVKADRECLQSDREYSDNIYGETKYQAESELLKVGKNSGMRVTIIRSPLVYGPNVKGNLKVMLKGIQKGWFPPIPDTGNKKSMIHIDDLVRAILLVDNDSRSNGEIFTISDGREYSSYEIYNELCNASGKSIPKWRVPEVLFRIVSLVGSKTIKQKIEKLLGNEYCPSSKIKTLGFEAKKSLKDINETSF